MPVPYHSKIVKIFAANKGISSFVPWRSAVWYYIDVVENRAINSH